MVEMTLGDALELIIDHRGKTPKKLGGDFASSGVPVISAVNIKDGTLEFGGEPRRVTPEMYSRWMPIPLREGDVLLTSEAPLGEAARVPSDAPMVLGQRLFALRGKPGVLDNRYLYYLLRWQPVRTRLTARSTGTTVLGIRQAELVKVQIPVPPMREQKAIADVLGAIDDKIANDQAIQGLLEERLSALFEASKFDAASATAVGLADLIEVNPVRARPRPDGAPYIDMAALPTTSALVTRVGWRRSGSGARFTNGDTLMARITPCLENGKTAFVDCLPEGVTGVGSTEFIVLRPRQGLPDAFAYLLARSPRFREYAVRHMSGSSGRQRCPAEAIARYPIDRPHGEAITRLAGESEVGLAAMRSAANESVCLKQLRDALLPPLLSGNLKIREAEDTVRRAV